MNAKRTGPAPFPSRDEIVEFLRGSDGPVGKRELARAFHLNADQKVLLKQVLRELESEGVLHKGRDRQLVEPGRLPPTAMVVITGVDEDGDPVARPMSWNEAELGAPPTIVMLPERRRQTALGIGERVLAKLEWIRPGLYEGRTVRRVAAAPARVMGIYTLDGREARIRPTDKRNRGELVVAPQDSLGAKPGELVRAEIMPGRRLGLRSARVVERLTDAGSGPRAIDAIVLHEHEIPVDFTPDALKQAEAARAAPLGGRTDLRTLPLVTIDGEDARDFDDAVWAEPDADPANPGGWTLVVAIADVAWYVRPGDAIDRCAYERGNSVYLPDRAVHMLPEKLSAHWCSLRPGEDRPCLVARIRITAEGEIKSHRFERAMMRSAARLTYRQVQAARDGQADDSTGPLRETVIAPLYGAYDALMKARVRRGVLEIDVPERQVVLDDAGDVNDIRLRERLDSHRLIEEFMICANVAAAETLERKKQNCMYRIHDAPSLDKLESLRQVLDGLDMPLSRGKILRPQDFNRILAKAAGTPNAPLVNEMILRTQAQAAYAPGNIGHFGLALRRYCHFTSPIRRYADLLVHRALIRGLKLGEGGLEDMPRDFVDQGAHVSSTERRAAAAERDAVDRFTALYLASKVGTVVSGRITGVTRFGLFVTLHESGGDGLLPMALLPADRWDVDESRQELSGRGSRRVFRLGDTVEVLLADVDPLTGGIILHFAGGGVESQRKGRPSAFGPTRAGRKPRPRTNGKTKRR